VGDGAAPTSARRVRSGEADLPFEVWQVGTGGTIDAPASTYTGCVKPDATLKEIRFAAASLPAGNG